ncbi:MAG: hypothetical protein V1859_09010 [archaeon]
MMIWKVCYYSTALMDKSLFTKIIDDLARINYNGRLMPHFYGEPLLDDRLVDLMNYTHKKLPKAQIVVYSNGDYLTKEKYSELINAGVHHFVITQHGDKIISELSELLENPKTRRRIQFRKSDTL